MLIKMVSDEKILYLNTDNLVGITVHGGVLSVTTTDVDSWYKYEYESQALAELAAHNLTSLIAGSYTPTTWEAGN
jgi:hypothetical protein